MEIKRIEIVYHVAVLLVKVFFHPACAGATSNSACYFCKILGKRADSIRKSFSLMRGRLSLHSPSGLRLPTANRQNTSGSSSRMKSLRPRPPFSGFGSSFLSASLSPAPPAEHWTAVAAPFAGCCLPRLVRDRVEAPVKFDEAESACWAACRRTPRDSGAEFQEFVSFSVSDGNYLHLSVSAVLPRFNLPRCCCMTRMESRRDREWECDGWPLVGDRLYDSLSRARQLDRGCYRRLAGPKILTSKLQLRSADSGR
jgi:hypothetical protein